MASQISDGDDDGVADSLDFPELLFVVFLLSALVVIQPLHSFLDGSLNLLILIGFKLVSRLVLVADLVLHVVDIGLEAVPSINPFLHLIVFLSKLLGLLHDTLDFFLAKATLVVAKQVPGSLDGDNGLLVSELLDLGNPSASTNKNNLLNLALLQTSILHGLLDRAHGLPKKIVVQFLKTCPGEWLREINTIE
ncbi:LOW QUALITY PROTEIN: hypothetical protein Cgig2_016002 [Carnegiea gigantea]|uniref:Uncharacterized protein n=1 Tax=Carnegiea gigantea TaxID=171969 RepID=A0A9Q1KKQ0_9CARY|nr:LOW QUALITY PROTEIN: hypothetical protein Cgig2_016002 [Carnegiea gigantea]